MLITCIGTTNKDDFLLFSRHQGMFFSVNALIKDLSQYIKKFGYYHLIIFDLFLFILQDYVDLSLSMALDISLSFTIVPGFR